MAAVITDWTDIRLDKLKTLALDGASASAIASALGGTTRNAVISKVRRLRRDGLLPMPSGETAMPQLRPKRRPAKRQALHFGKARARTPRRILMPDVMPGACSTYLPATFFGGTLALRDGMCRWPFGDPRKGVAYCGRDADGSYCPHHHSRAGRRAGARLTSKAEGGRR